MNAVKLDTWEKRLMDRGILGEARKLLWLPDGAYWRYPTFNLDGSQSEAYRLKAFDSAASPKYLWKPANAQRPAYYLPPDTLKAISEAANSVVLTSGEPDTLTLRSAGANNCINWFGEGNTPATLAADLLSFGVEVVECYPDLDDTGMRWARSIVTALADTLISVRVLQLPGAENSKYDLNQLWIDLAFDTDKFWDALVRCPVLDVQPASKPTLDDHKLLPLFEEHQADLPAAFYAAIEQGLGVEKYKANGWSENVRCPFHDDSNPSAGWHKDKHILKCLVCHPANEFALAKDVAERLNIRLVDFLPQKPVKPVTDAPRGQVAGKPSIIVSWEQATDRFLADLEGTGVTGEPLPMPFADLRNLGGFARHLSPGKCLAIVADSGIGKTTLAETLMDHWREHGFHGVIWGAEWTSQEYVQRAVQRQGGPAFDMVEQHKVWQTEDKRGVVLERRSGKVLPPADLERLKTATAELRAWTGKLHFIEKMDLPVEQIVARMADVSSAWKAAGQRLSFAVLDYAQLVSAHGFDDVEKLKQVLATFKRFCVDNQLVGVVGSQVTKADGRASDGGSKGNLHSLVGARSDVFNLVLILTREVDAQGNRSNLANVRVVKNSTGMVGDRKLFLKPERMKWYDAKLGEQ